MHMKRIGDPGNIFKVNRRDGLFSTLGNGRIIVVSILVLAFCAVGAILFFSLTKSSSDEYADYYNKMKVGYLAGESVYSDDSYYLIDELKSQEAYDSYLQKIPPVFSNTISICLKTVDDSDLLFQALRSGREAFMSQAQSLGVSFEIADVAYDSFQENTEVYGSLMVEIIQQVIQSGLYSPQELLQYAADSGSVTSLLSFEDLPENFLKVAKTTCLVPEKVSAFVEQKMISHPKQASIMGKLIAAMVQPNMRYNELFTQRARQEVDKESFRVVYNIVPNQIIVEENTIITEEESRILLLLSQQDTSVPTERLIGTFLILLMVSCICLFFFDYIARDSLHEFEFLLVLFGGAILSEVAAFFLYRLSQSIGLVVFEGLLPVFALPLLISLLSDNRGLGAIGSFLISACFSLIPGATFVTFFFCIASSSTCVLLVRFLNRRRDLLLQWVFSFALSLVYLVITFLLRKNSLAGFLHVAEFDLFNIMLCFIVVSVLLPLLEETMNIPTLFKLREMANAKSPILERLSQEAPGTYSHSMAVADIAETAARVVGANASLVRVGAMYHDIGKIDHAEYFTENISLLKNIPEEKSHENLNRNLSVAIIKSHVKLGVEKGKQIGLPQEVLEIIGNHHGNDVVTYFYNQALADYQANPQQYSEPKIEEYTYLGNPPQTPEQAIVMLADCSEAACRSISKPTPNKIEKMITMILIKKIVNKQLNSCNLTITDLNKIVKSMSESLTGRFHSRISYPNDEKEK